MTARRLAVKNFDVYKLDRRFRDTLLRSPSRLRQPAREFSLTRKLNYQDLNLSPHPV